MLPSVKVPAGFDYQWVTLAVGGDEELGDAQRMHNGGWRAVPQDRHPDIRTQIKGMIVVGDLLLVERPKIMTTQSRAIEKIAADAPIEAIRQNTINPKPRPSTNAFHWWPRLKFQFRRPFVWIVGVAWRWWRK